MAYSVLRFRKLCYVEPVVSLSSTTETRNKNWTNTHNNNISTNNKDNNIDNNEKKKETRVVGGGGVIECERAHDKRRKGRRGGWRCVDTCCWVIGCVCSLWWLAVLGSELLAGGAVREFPGERLRREEGLSGTHPVVLIPGIVTGGLELWEGRPCSNGLFRKRLWGGSFSEIFKRPLCWLEHLSLHNETGLDPPGIRVRAVPGLVAADYFAPGYFVWAVLIENLAKLGYEGKNMYMAAYDWRLSFQNTEIRDQSLSRLKSKIELMYSTNGDKKVVVVPHSMGVIYFLHFMKWVETPAHLGGGGGGPRWCADHIKSIMNIGPVFLGVPKAVSSVFSAEGKDIAFVRAVAPGVLDSELLGLQTLEHLMRVSRTWDSIISLLPKGGDTIWGDLDRSPDEEYKCGWDKRANNDINLNHTDRGVIGFQENKEPMKYGRIISFGKSASEIPSSRLPSPDLKELLRTDSSSGASPPCGDVWTEYDEMRRESIKKVPENKAYTARTSLDLLRFVAPKLMQRTEAHFSHGIADDLDDPKYQHYKYWSNPLETELPNAPEMEIYCLYGVGIPTERSYIYKQSPTDKCKSIPFRIDSSVDGDPGQSCLRNGVYFVDGDESVPVLSAGFMCAKGWRGRTRFNPSGAQTYIREYKHKPPASFLEGRGAESGAHVDIMGNVALIEDVLRVTAGSAGAGIGGDRIYSDIVRISERVNLQL